MRLIDADEAYKMLADYFHTRTEIQHKALKEALGKVPTADVVSVPTYAQMMWERNVAIDQLKEIGKGFGEKMDDVVKLVRCYDCQHSSVISKETNEGYCDLLNIEVTSMFGCVYGRGEDE